MRGSELSNMRHKMGLSQTGCASKIPCPVSTYRDWEQDRTEAPEMIKWFFKYHGIE